MHCDYTVSRPTGIGISEVDCIDEDFQEVKTQNGRN